MLLSACEPSAARFLQAFILIAMKPMSARTFLDTNVLIYALAEDDPRSARAEALLAGRIMVSVQVLNEFAAVARRKLRMSWEDVTAALDAIRTICPAPVPITLHTHQTARAIAVQYGYGIYDALVAAAALRAGCATLYSEDMRDGQVIERSMTIRNPFIG
jgi:predicted nucleic acid-binding protein